MESDTSSDVVLLSLDRLITSEYHLSVNNALAAVLKHADPDEARPIVASDLNLGHIQQPEFSRRHSGDNVLSVAAWVKYGWGFEISKFAFTSFQVPVILHTHLAFTFFASHDARSYV